MAPLPEDNSAKSTTFHNFFSSVSTQGFPAVKQSTQKWKGLGLRQPDTKKPEAENKMLVLCSERHDYGSSGLGGY